MLQPAALDYRTNQLGRSLGPGKNPRTLRQELENGYEETI